MKKTLILVAASVMLLSTRTVAAEPDTAEVEAYNLYKESQAFMDQSQWDKAIEILDRAWTVFPMPQIAFRKAKCLQFKGELAKALALLNTINTDDPRLRGKIDATIDDVRRELSKPLEIEVKSDAEQVRMVVDGNTVFFVPGKISIPQGNHRIEYTAPGFKPKVEERFFGPADRSMTLTLEPVGGRVVLKTNLDSFFGVVVKIDDMELMPSGTSINPNKASAVEIPAGRHRFTCMKAGMPDYSGEFTLVSTQTLEVECLLAPVKKVERKRNPWTWAFLGIGTAMAAGGAGLTGWYYWRKADAESKGLRISTDYYEGPIGIGISAVGIALAVMGFFVFPDVKEDDSGNKSKTSWNFGVTPVQDGAAAAVSVRFN